MAAKFVIPCLLTNLLSIRLLLVDINDNDNDNDNDDDNEIILFGHKKNSKILNIVDICIMLIMLVIDILVGSVIAGRKPELSIPSK